MSAGIHTDSLNNSLRGRALSPFSSSWGMQLAFPCVNTCLLQWRTFSRFECLLSQIWCEEFTQGGHNRVTVVFHKWEYEGNSDPKTIQIQTLAPSWNWLPDLVPWGSLGDEWSSLLKHSFCADLRLLIQVDHTAICLLNVPVASTPFQCQHPLLTVGWTSSSLPLQRRDLFLVYAT